MPEFDIVFEKLNEILQEAEGKQSLVVEHVSTSARELDEIEELRRLSAEIQEPDPPSFTTT